MPSDRDLLWNEMINHLHTTASKHHIGSGKIMPYPIVFEAVCRKYSVTKDKGWRCLQVLKKMNAIEFVPCHGIILK